MNEYFVSTIDKCRLGVRRSANLTVEPCGGQWKQGVDDKHQKPKTPTRRHLFPAVKLRVLTIDPSLH